MKKELFTLGWTCNGNPVTVPHDAMLREKRSPKALTNSAGAYFETGEYEYVKTFEKPEAPHVVFYFEGVYKNAKVYINDQEAGGCAYGYRSFYVKADEFLREGENTIKVTCSNKEQPDSRWYSGAGIFRPVWMMTGPENSIEPESVRITTVQLDPAVIRITSEKEISVGVFEKDREEMKAFGEGKEFELTIDKALLWSDETPNLYTAKVSNGEDETEITFGIRKITWSTQGLYINGKSTLLRGGCIHADNGILGSAVYDESEYRRVKAMKDAGFNAIRSAHNPTSRALLEACDRLGMYVMDETWDMWFSPKNKFDYSNYWRENFIADIDALISRDYNHPSVIMYSIGNEVSEPVKEEGIKVEKEMVEHIHAIDSTRPVTGGFNLMIMARSAVGKGLYDEEGGGLNAGGQESNSGMSSTLFNMIASFVGTGMNKAANSKKTDAATSPGLDLLDIAGYNYASGRYPLEAKVHPDRVIVGSETFPGTIAKNWAMVEKYPYLIGDFMWTAIDYLGEAGIGGWTYDKGDSGFAKKYPWLLGDTGAMDILLNPTGELFHAAAVWHKLDQPAICVQPINHDGKVTKAVWRDTNSIPSWSWRGCEGKKAVVEVYTDAYRIELYLNDKPVGKAKVKESKAEFTVKYVPGCLLAVAYDASGREVGRTELVSAEKKCTISLLPEKECVNAGEVFFIPVQITDKNGVVESNFDKKIQIKVENGELLGFGSANPKTEERFETGEYTTYYGQALLCVRAGASGQVKITAESGRVKKDISIPVI